MQFASNAIFGNRQELVFLVPLGEKEYYEESKLKWLGFTFDVATYQLCGARNYEKIIPYSNVSTREITQDIKTIFETVYNVIFAFYSIDEDEYLRDKNGTYLQCLPSEKKSDCFVATACYGNYSAPEVLALRT